MMIHLCSLLFLLFTACSQKGNWEHSQIRGDSDQFSSTRLSFVPRDAYHRIQFEVICSSKGQNGYLFLHAHPIETDKKREVLVFFSSKDESFSSLAVVHEGGQRLSLPEETTNKLLSYLIKGNAVEITLLGNKTTLDPEGFLAHYEQCKKPSSFPKLWKSL